MKSTKRLFAKGKLSGILFGLLTIAFGFWVRSHDEDTFFSRGFSVPRTLWILFVIIGFAWLLYSIIYKNKPNSEYDFVKCKSCKGSFYRSETQNNICPKCGKLVECLDGYYQRNPEDNPDYNKK